MKAYRLGAVEARFADLIWANAPLTTRELVKLCQKELQWKRTAIRAARAALDGVHD